MDIWQLTVQEIVQSILNRETTSEEYLEATFKRIEDVEDRVKSYVTLTKNQALKKAKEVDRQIQRGEPVGKLAGLPVRSLVLVGRSTLRLARRMVSFPVDPVLPTQSEVHDTIE